MKIDKIKTKHINTTKKKYENKKIKIVKIKTFAVVDQYQTDFSLFFSYRMNDKIFLNMMK